MVPSCFSRPLGSIIRLIYPIGSILAIALILIRRSYFNATNMAFEAAHLPSRVSRRSQHGLATRAPKSNADRTSRVGTAGRGSNSETETRHFLAEIGPRRTTGRHRESEDRPNFLRKRPNQETLRLANLPRDDNTRNNSRNWSATTTRRFRHSRGTRNAPNLPNINPDRRLRNPTPATLPRGELTISRHRTALCGVCTVAGLKPGNPRWQNQDSYVISEDVPANAHQHCFAVLDGHGEVGHLVSQRCRDRLCGHFWESDLNMHRTFRLMQQDLNECNFDVKCSGATCVFAYIHGPHLRVANVGDSRGILGHLESGKICAVPLTSDHKPDRPDEQRRILACGGQVSCRQLVVGHGSNGPITLPLGPPRVWYRRHHSHGDTMGLAMSRSFGDSIVHSA